MRSQVRVGIALCAAAVAAVLMGAGATGAAAQGEVVTICHATSTDTFETIVVPAGDPQIAVHEGHAGDIIQQGETGCPAPPPVDNDPPPLPDPPGCPGCEQPPSEPLTSGGGGGAPVSAPAGGAPAAGPLPSTGAELPVLAGLLVLAGSMSIGLRIASRRLRR